MLQKLRHVTLEKRNERTAQKLPKFSTPRKNLIFTFFSNLASFEKTDITLEGKKTEKETVINFHS